MDQFESLARSAFDALFAVARKEPKMSDQQIAERSGLSRPAVNEYRNGNRTVLNMAHFFALCRAVGADPLKCIDPHLEETILAERVALLRATADRLESEGAA